jgi:hypothetical protein
LGTVNAARTVPVEPTVLLVVRTVATYAAAAGLLIVAARRLVAPIRSRVAWILAAAPLLFTGPAIFTGGVYAPADVLYDAYPFGARRAELGIPPDRTPILSDVAYQMLPWAAVVRRAAAERRLPLWNPYALTGEPLLAVQQPGVLHPVTLFSLAVPFPQSFTFALTLRILLALLAAYLFLREIWCGEAAALLGALGWAFCDWMTFYLGYPVQPAAAPLPLLLLGLRRIARDPDARAGAITAVALFLSVTAGNPETLLHASALGGLYFLFELRAAPAGRRLRAAGVAAAAGLAGAGLSAAALLPFLEALPLTFEHGLRRAWYAHQPRAVPLGLSLARLAASAMPVVGGASGHGETLPNIALPGAYGGALLMPLAFTGLFARCRTRWFFLAAAAAALAVAAGTPAAEVVARLPLFDIAINERLFFVAALSLCVLGALGADRLAQGEGAPAFVAGSAASLALVLLLAERNRARWLELATPPAYVRERLLLEAVPLVLGAALVAALPRRVRARAGVPALAILLAASRVLEAGRTYPTFPAAAVYPRFPILERMPRGEPWRIAGIGNALIPNTAAAYGLEDARGYEAMTLARLHETFPLWCVPQPIWFNRVDDATRPFLSFLNVRWLLTEASAPAPAGWRAVADGDGLRLFENPRPLPRAFAPRRVLRLSDPTAALEALRGVDDFSERGVVEEAPASDWADNGSATVAVSSYAPRELELDVEAQAASVVGTSIPAWPGWTAELERRRLPLLTYNHAFIGFRVPPGRHRVRVRYAPASFRIGAGVALATLVLGGLALARSRR